MKTMQITRFARLLLGGQIPFKGRLALWPHPLCEFCTKAELASLRSACRCCASAGSIGAGDAGAGTSSSNTAKGIAHAYCSLGWGGDSLGMIAGSSKKLLTGILPEAYKL